MELSTVSLRFLTQSVSLLALLALLLYNFHLTSSVPATILP
jgi:hypothetical protein